MKEHITLDVAHRLFLEAHDFYSGRTLFLSEDSEIRQIAKAVFHEQHTMYLVAVCEEIFYVVASYAMGEPR